KRFTYCFIPDFPGEINLSGRLSHWCRLPENARFIGILSRFQSFPEPLSPSIKLLPTDISRREEDISYIYCTAIMSGPSPQKELLASKIKDILLKTGKNSVILSGNISSESIIQKEDNIQIINHLPEDEFAEIVGRSEIIISRSGYTTVMELFSLGRSAILIPTPGQPEQEYLAEYLSGKRWFIHLNQRNLSTNTMFELPDLTLPKFNASENEKLLNAALEELLKE
ncbi:MAG TPA: glycosyltransferase, partial [Bacteroidales bacterium]|nr:glycosyltransferase [Bacteroidales bacterium]